MRRARLRGLSASCGKLEVSPWAPREAVQSTHLQGLPGDQGPSTIQSPASSLWLSAIPRVRNINVLVLPGCYIGSISKRSLRQSNGPAAGEMRRQSSSPTSATLWLQEYKAPKPLASFYKSEYYYSLHRVF